MAAQHKAPFILATSLAPWDTTSRQWLVDHEKVHVYSNIATATVVFNPEGKVLLIQRAVHDTKPNMWEVPGGAVDDDDPTIIHAAARELREEAGLVATRFTRVVSEGPGREFEQLIPNRAGTKVWCRFTFVAEVESSKTVILDPNEHQDYLWASKEEVQAQRVGERDIPITSDSVALRLLEAFRLRDEDQRR